MKTITSFREWQLDAWNKGRGSQYCLFQAPGGSGKSLLQVMLALTDIKTRWAKQLILVPQNHIHYGFDDVALTLPGSDSPARWRIGNNLCDSSGCTDGLRQFLLTDADNLRERELAAITSHKCMVAVWQSLSQKEKKRALKKIAFRIDEAHHISNVFHESELSLYNEQQRETIAEDATRLGSFVTELLQTQDSTCKLHLTTATFFRGDRRAIISKAFREQFVHYALPWDEHFANLGIDLVFDFVTYQQDPIDQVVHAVANEPKERHLIIIPALTTRYRTASTLDTLMRKLYQVVPQSQVLDLVTPDTQENHKRALFERPDCFNVVVACRLFDEGTDWVPCTRMHNTDAGEKSLTLSVQRFFRPLRQHPKKRKVVISNYIPAFLPEMTLEEQRAALSDRFNALLASIITQGELVPIFVPASAAKAAECKSRSVHLQDLFGEQFPAMVTELIDGYERLEDREGTEVDRLITEVLEGYDLPVEVDIEDVKAGLGTILLRAAARKDKHSDRTSLAIAGFDVRAIREQGFDKVWQKSPHGSTLIWGTDHVDSSVIRELLNVVKPAPTREEIKNAIESYYRRTGKRPLISHRTRNAWFDELSRSLQSVAHICKRHYGITFAALVTEVLGSPADTTRKEGRKVIAQYYNRGEPLNRSTPHIQELGISGETLDNRLRHYCKTTIRKETEAMFGKLQQAKPLSLTTLKGVMRLYKKRGDTFLKRYFVIPELGMTNSHLRHRVKRDFGYTLEELWQKC